MRICHLKIFDECCCTLVLMNVFAEATIYIERQGLWKK